MTTDLRALIQDIEQNEPTRELNDRVLLAIGWIAPEHGRTWWVAPDESFVPPFELPSPLTDLEDAKLAVPEGCSDILFKSQLLPKSRHDVIIWVPVREKLTMFQAVAATDARALVLAGLKAREQEAEG